MKAITWNQERMGQLRAALDAAKQARGATFTVKIEGHGEHRFTISAASEVLRYLEKEFANNPPKVYPPNREGKEGE